MITSDYLYFPECKIQQAHFVPSGSGVISFHIKSLKPTPSHYPQHSLLEGKAEFYFGLELSKNFKQNKHGIFYDLFHTQHYETATKLKGKKVCVIVLFNPNSTKKIDTIGIGFENSNVVLYNDNLNKKEIDTVNQMSQLNWKLQSKKNKEKIIKI